MTFYVEGPSAVERHRFPETGAGPRRPAPGLPGFRPKGLPGPRRAAAHQPLVYVDDCDALLERLVQIGATVTDPTVDQPWGERVAKLLDPDGNEVILGQR